MVEAVSIAVVEATVEEDPDVAATKIRPTTIIQIIQIIHHQPHKDLTRRVQGPHRMFRITRAPGTGKKAEMRPTAPTP